jgi:preprotein translocase subunit SecF
LAFDREKRENLERIGQRMKFLQIVPTVTNIDFIGKFKYFVIFSILSGIAVVAMILTKGFNYGIDFTGGTVIQVKFNEPHHSDEIRKIMASLNEPDASVVGIGGQDLEYLITARTVSEKGVTPLHKKIQDLSGHDANQILKVEIVGPKVGSELKLASLRALFYSVILITIYIWLRFDFRFAPGATIAMVHDLLLSSGFYLLTGREFTITAVAALLTIAGYSVNDTIVVYDRVREILKKGGDQLHLDKTVNKAVNLTLSRTLLTSGITFISIVPIIFFCTGEIQSFAMAMCFGIFVGTYSTVYIASPFAIYVNRFVDKRKLNRGRTVSG